MKRKIEQTVVSQVIGIAVDQKKKLIGFYNEKLMYISRFEEPIRLKKK